MGGSVGFWSFARRLDEALHSRLNVVFGWVQKQFHVNRFWLIWFLMWVTVTAAAGAGVGQLFVWKFSGWQEVDVSSLILVALVPPIWHVKIFPLISEVRALSRRYENGQQLKLSEQILRFAHATKEFRPLVNIVLIGLLLDPRWLFGDVTSGEIVMKLMAAVMKLAVLLEYHLWDSDDIDPRDRNYLFDPDYARDTA